MRAEKKKKSHVEVALIVYLLSKPGLELTTFVFSCHNLNRLPSCWTPLVTSRSTYFLFSLVNLPRSCPLKKPIHVGGKFIATLCVFISVARQELHISSSS